MSKELLSYHETNHNSDFYRWDDQTALLKLSEFCVTLVPATDVTNEPGETKRRYVREFLDTAPTRNQELSFAALSAWANRRASKFTRFVVCCDCENEDRSWGCDYQRVMGAVFDRRLIRECIQWLYQERVPPDAVFNMRLVPTPPPKSGESPKHFVLVMRCSGWTGIVMCCRPETEHGSDPLFSEVDGGAP